MARLNSRVTDATFIAMGLHGIVRLSTFLWLYSMSTSFDGNALLWLQRTSRMLALFGIVQAPSAIVALFGGLAVIVAGSWRHRIIAVTWMAAIYCLIVYAEPVTTSAFMVIAILIGIPILGLTRRNKSARNQAVRPVRRNVTTEAR